MSRLFILGDNTSDEAVGTFLT